MSEVEIEIPDEPRAPGTPPPVDGQGEESGGSPYKNLLVPLVVVPALIVMVLVLVFTLFGAIAGEEDSPAENIERILSGGVNEREQAAFNLVRQVLEDLEAQAAGEEGQWDVDETLLPRLKEVWEQNSTFEESGDVPIPLSVACIMALIGDPEGVEHLAEVTRLGSDVDPNGEHRFQAAQTLGALGHSLDGPSREVASRSLIDLLENDDQGLQAIAVIALQTYDSEASVAALESMLPAPVLEIRGNAALSLASLGRDAGATVLREMLGRDVYEVERAAEPNRWPAQRVSESRSKALEALAQIGAAPSAAELEALAEDDPDAGVRALARKLLETNG